VNPAKRAKRAKRASDLTRVIMDDIMSRQGVRDQFRDGYAVTYARVHDAVDAYVIRDK